MLHRKTLLVIAHPDDEVMFFYPTVRALRELQSERSNATFSILCLSDGGFDGLGAVRAAEMRTAGAAHGAVRVTVVDDARLRDGAAWTDDAVADVVSRHLDDAAVITFDAGGASGHPNHCATSTGVRRALASSPRAHYELRTAPLATRLLGPLDAAVYRRRRRRRHVLTTTNLGPWAAWRAMATGHPSQFVWYRRIFLLLSAYTYANRLVEVDRTKNSTTTC